MTSGRTRQNKLVHFAGRRCRRARTSPSRSRGPRRTGCAASCATSWRCRVRVARASRSRRAEPRSRHLALVGPTATGKSAVALAVAEALGDVEIVSIDSMQVYRGMDIGTAKPTPDERARVPHHLIDIVDPGED